MGRKPASVQSDSDRLEPRLVKAVVANNVPEVKDVIEQAQGRKQYSEHFLEFLAVGLIKACDQNFPDVARLLLKHGANPDYASDTRPPSLLRAAEHGRTELVGALLDHGANIEASEKKKGRTALMTAAWKGQFDVVKLLLARGASVETRDNRNRNVLHNLAADKGTSKGPGSKPIRKCGMDIVQYILQAGVDVEAKDEEGRTPLHWTCVTDHEDLLRVLLTTRIQGGAPRAHVNAKNNREMTPLQFAASRGLVHLVKILIQSDADVRNRSDGGWTALHNACSHRDGGTAPLLEALLHAGAEINAELMNGRTPLHVAAESGNKDAVQCLLRQSTCRSATRDRFGNTPLLLAALRKHEDIAEMLAPWNHLNELSEEEIDACKTFKAKIVDFGDFPNGNRVMKNPPTIYELLYAKSSKRDAGHEWTTLPTKMKATNLRWIHLPANNVAWCDALLKKRFVEEGTADVEGYKALETSFNHQHRGHHHHSRFMRPMCQVIRRSAADDEPSLVEKAGPPPKSSSSKKTLAAVPETTMEPQEERVVLPSLERQSSPSTMAGAETSQEIKAKQKHKQTRPTTQRQDTTSTSATAESFTGMALPGIARKSLRQDTASTVEQSDNSANTAHARTRDTNTFDATKSSKKPTSRKSVSRKTSGAFSAQKSQNSCNLFMFMPYLHFETHGRRKEMQRCLEHPERLRGLGVTAEADEILIRAHLSKTASFLHVRRTLDQFFYHNIDTSFRDEDQVVFRFQRDHRDEPDADPKIFMVDQLWLWIVGRDLVVTSFPQRWRQPRNDPLDVFEGIVEDINAVKTREPVKNVYELAMVIAGRCFGTFDRHRKNDDGFQFLDMFGASLGDAMDREARRFEDFSKASRQASQWLQSHQRPEKLLRHLQTETRTQQHAAKKIDKTEANNFEPRDTEFIDKLLDVGPETDLLAEIKDIRDELDILKMVLEHQKYLLPDLRRAVTSIYEEERSLGQVRKLNRTFEDQEKTIINPLKDIARMEDQAKRIYESIRDLLDLKQKHANAFEARFAREQALGAQRQGQTIMVFTIVTVIFLPLSFIAAFFAINIDSFPHNDATGQQQMSLGYVSQYIFGIGLAISIPCIAIALSVDELSYTMKRVRLRWRQLWAGRNTDQIQYERQTLKIEQALSVARSTKRSMEVTWHDKSFDIPRRNGGDSGWNATYNRRRPSLWDEERGKRTDLT